MVLVKYFLIHFSETETSPFTLHCEISKATTRGSEKCAIVDICIDVGELCGKPTEIWYKLCSPNTDATIAKNHGDLLIRLEVVQTPVRIE